MRVVILSVIALGLSAGGVLAQDGDISAATFVRGDCTYLSILDQDITGDCQGSLFYSEYTNDRVNMAFFITRERGAMGFSGQMSTRTLEGGVIVQPLDRIILLGPGGAPDAGNSQIAGEGECRWSDFSAGVTLVTCQFLADDGTPASGSFQTDGLEPTIQRF